MTISPASQSRRRRSRSRGGETRALLNDAEGKARPRGITFLALYYAVVGIGLVALTVVGIYVWRTIPRALEAFSDNPEPLVGIAVIVGSVHGSAAWGLWNLRRWSIVLVVGLCALGVVFGLFTLPLGFASVMLNLTTFWYVTHHRTRKAFIASPLRPRLE